MRRGQSPSPAEPAGFSKYGAYIKEQVDAQQARKASLEQRGLSVITSSGALVTLLFGLAALSTKEAQTFALPGAARVLLVLALASFFGAILSAIGSNLPFKYEMPLVPALRAVVDDRWGDSEQDAERRLARTRLKMLESAKAKNTVKAYWLFTAVGFEVAAVALVASAVGVVIWG